jgi:hypothetical protein
MRTYQGLVCMILFFILTSCTSTKIVSSWSDTSKEVKNGALNKILVVALFKTETNSRNAEDEMVRYLKGKGVQSYKYLGPRFNKNNENNLREKAKKDGFDGAVTIRLIDVDKEQIYQPSNFSTYPQYYQNFNDYFFRTYPSNSTSGYYETTKTYTYESNFYSLDANKIIWTGITKSTNPEGVVKMTNEIVKVVYKEISKEGFINKK